jgi:alpha,alpha-trehalase
MGSVDNATKTFGSLILTLGRYNGTFPGSFLVTGLQWDAPK